MLKFTTQYTNLNLSHSGFTPFYVHIELRGQVRLAPIYYVHVELAQ